MMQRRFCLSPRWGVVLLVLFGVAIRPASVADSGRPANRQEILRSDMSQARFPRPARDKPDGLKSVVGQVVDKEDGGLAEAVVHLKNKRTLEVKTHITDKDGNFRFRALNPNVDYEVHAEFQGASSRKRGVSSLDSRREVYLVLRIDTSK